MKMKAKQTRKVLFEFDGAESGLPPVGSSDVMLRRILAPVDFTDCSRKAVCYAMTLGQQFLSEVVLLHVVKPLTPALSPELVVLDTDPMNAKVHENAARQLARWRREYGMMARVRAVVRSGFSVQQEIIDAARENNVDLIVLATHDKSSLTHLFTGSVAEQVVRHAPCPVLLLREEERDFIAPRPGWAGQERANGTVSRRRH